MFEATTRYPDPGIRRYAVNRRGVRLSWREVLELWCGADEGFREFFTTLLRDSEFDCFRFETPPLTASSTGGPFEFVLVHDPGIDLSPDPGDFREHFKGTPSDVLVFPNLGRDAVLIVPRPRPPEPGWAHVAAFSRHAPRGLQQALWRSVGEQLQSRLGAAPFWLNTAGGGVPWLHVRLDTRPKYYVFREYARGPDF